MDAIVNPVLPEAIVPGPAVPTTERELVEAIGAGRATGLPTASEQYAEMINKRAAEVQRAKTGSTMGGSKPNALQIGAQLPTNGATGVQI